MEALFVVVHHARALFLLGPFFTRLQAPLLSALFVRSSPMAR
jgi:hypothetical protein